MLLRNWFKNSALLGNSPPRSNRMVAVVLDPKSKKYVPAAEWKRVQEIEAARIAEEAKNEPYDLSYRSPVSTTRTQGYDFSQ